MSFIQNINTGQSQNPPKEFTVTLAAGQRYRLDFVHSFFRVLSASSTDYTVKFGGFGTDTPLQPLIGIQHPNPLDFVEITNTSASPNTVTFIMSVGFITDDRVAFAGLLNTNSGTSFASPAWVSCTSTATQIVAASPNRSTVLIRNRGTVPVFLGDSTVDPAARGMRLDVNEYQELATSGAVFGRTASGTAVVEVLEIGV
jgi:hypothetical protein